MRRNALKSEVSELLIPTIQASRRVGEVRVLVSKRVEYRKSGNKTQGIGRLFPDAQGALTKLLGCSFYLQEKNKKLDTDHKLEQGMQVLFLCFPFVIGYAPYDSTPT